MGQRESSCWRGVWSYVPLTSGAQERSEERRRVKAQQYAIKVIQEAQLKFEAAADEVRGHSSEIVKLKEQCVGRRPTAEECLRMRMHMDSLAVAKRAATKASQQVRMYKGVHVTLDEQAHSTKTNKTLGHLIKQLVQIEKSGVDAKTQLKALKTNVAQYEQVKQAQTDLAEERDGIVDGMGVEVGDTDAVLEDAEVDAMFAGTGDTFAKLAELPSPPLKDVSPKVYPAAASKQQLNTV